MLLTDQQVINNEFALAYLHIAYGSNSQYLRSACFWCLWLSKVVFDPRYGQNRVQLGRSIAPVFN